MICVTVFSLLLRERWALFFFFVFCFFFFFFFFLKARPSVPQVDDALGEAYDKAARMLAIAAPTGGGPAIEALAVRGNATAIPLPVPLQKRKRDCDFSYAGLKNSFRGHVAAAREREAHPRPNPPQTIS